MAFSPDGRRLVSGSADESVKIWDSATGKELFTLKGHPGIVNSVAFSPDGQRLVAASEDCIILRESSVPPEVWALRATYQLVADLFREMALRADVLQRLRTLGLNQAHRHAALAAAQTYPENPDTLNQLARKVVALPDRRILAYRKALRYSEEACQLEPGNGNYLNTLSVANYRVGNYEKALETLLRSDSIHKIQFDGSSPADLAFLAMTQQRLGHAKEARAYLQQLRERMKDSRFAEDAEAQGFLREAEALLANQKTPGGK